LAVCGVVRCEVGRALRPEATLQRFQKFWDVMIYVPADNRLWEEVERTVWMLDRQGNVLPLTDIIIACCAKRIGAAVLTFDSDFWRIPGVRAIRDLDY
jgi:predicted nucleic acid-binding protein